MRIRPFSERVSPDRLVTAAVAGFFIMATPGTVWGECRPSVPKTENPEGFSTVTAAKLNPLRNLAASGSSVERLPRGEALEVGVFEAKSFGNAVWGCNFSNYESAGEIRQFTARHCVSDSFDGVNSDAWESVSFRTADVRVRVAKNMEKILSPANPPEEGEPAVLIGCFPNSRDCYRIEGTFAEIFRKGDEPTYGVWLPSEQYSKLVKGRLDATLEGLSGSPALDSDGKVFGTVSATVATDFESDAEGKCLPSSHAVAIAPIRKNPSVLAEGR